MSKIKPRNPRIFQQMELGAGGTAWAISEQARKNPKQNFLATDFKFVNERKYLRENARYGAKPFPPNLHLARGGALTVIKRLKQSGRKTHKIIVAMGTRQLLNPKYLGYIAKHAKEVLSSKGMIYFVSTWAPKDFKRMVVPRFKKEGYLFRQLKPNAERQMDHSGKAAAYFEEYGAVQWEYEFYLK